MWDFLKKTDVPIDNFSKTWITWESEIAKLFSSPSIKAELQDGKKNEFNFAKALFWNVFLFSSYSSGENTSHS